MVIFRVQIQQTIGTITNSKAEGVVKETEAVCQDEEEVVE